MSKNIEEYLRNLYSITATGGVASTNEMSRRLKVAPSSVTEMLKKLDEKGYIKYSPYQGAVLTDTGLKFGEKVTRRHRLLERFLYDILKLDKERVHAQACEMEHTLDDETERAMCKILKHRDKCPDDQKLIPPCDLRFDSCEECQERGGESLEKVGKRRAELASLSALKEHEAGQVAFIRGDARLLRRLSDQGLTFGARVEVTRVFSRRAPLEIACRGSRVALDEDMTSNVFVEKVIEEERARGQETLSTINKKLEERNRQNSIMSEMRELLQSCSTIQEMPPIVIGSIARLFPKADGALFLMNDSRKDLQSIARWGGLQQNRMRTCSSRMTAGLCAAGEFMKLKTLRSAQSAVISNTPHSRPTCACR